MKKATRMREIVSLVGIVSLCILPVMKEAYSFEIRLPSGFVIHIPDEKNQSTPHKQKKEFTPPELPYCRIKRADWEGVVIDYWDKWGEKHTYRWGVNNPAWYVGGATVDLVYEYPEQDDGTRNYEGLDECLIRAGKKVLKDSYYGGDGNLYIKKMTGYIFDHLTLYYNEE